MENNIIEYTFMRSEMTSEVILVVNVEPSWIEKEIDFEIQNEKIKIIVENREFNSEKLPNLVIDWIKNNSTNIYFANEEGQIISETTIGEEKIGTEN